MRKIIIIFFVIVLIIGGIIYGYTKSKNKSKEPATEEVVRGVVVQEVSESGTVNPAEEITLSFENGGQVKKIYIHEGDAVKTGQLLAELDSIQLYIQLEKAKAAFQTAQARLSQLLAGSSLEKIKIAETTLENALTTLQDAEQTLDDAKKSAEESLDNVYEDALNTLDGAYTKLYNAYYTLDTIQNTYFYNNDEEDQPKIIQSKGLMAKDMDNAKSFLDAAKSTKENNAIEAALISMKKALEGAFQTLSLVRDVCEKPYYRNRVSSTDKSSLDTEKSNINTQLTNIVGSQQAISSAKISNGASINAAEASLNQAKGKVQAAKDQLALEKAPPRQTDIDLYQYQVNEAQSQINLLGNQIARTILKSPLEGIVTEIAKKEGEIIKATESAVNIISSKPFQIKVNIYEEDIGKVKVADPAEISLVAFPNEKFQGTVSAINPAEKLIGGVVYYEVTVDFTSMPNNLRAGMTADIVIKTAEKENVIVVPTSSLISKNDKKFVEVFKDGEKGEIEEREIVTGLEGSNDVTEVLSGLEEGEKVLLP